MPGTQMVFSEKLLGERPAGLWGTDELEVQFHFHRFFLLLHLLWASFILRLGSLDKVAAARIQHTYFSLQIMCNEIGGVLGKFLSY